MSGITQSQVPARQRLVHVDRRARIIAVCAITAVTAMLVVLSLALAGEFSSTGTDESAAPAIQQPAVASPEPGVRYDGGPEEGTRAASPSPSPIAASADGVSGNTGSNRYDGGPEEGTRGPNR